MLLLLLWCGGLAPILADPCWCGGLAPILGGPRCGAEVDTHRRHVDIVEAHHDLALAHRRLREAEQVCAVLVILP